MDFLKIRRKAKERAARAAGEVQPARLEVTVDAPGPPEVPATVPTPAAATDQPPPAPPSTRWKVGSTEALRLEAELGNRVAELPHAPDPRFVTWRPDGGALSGLAAIGPFDGDRRPGTFETPDPVALLDPLDDFFYREDEAAPGLGLLVAPAGGGELLAPVALEEYLTFRMADETYAIAIGQVLEVMRTPPITEVPRAPTDVLGVISVRGEVITVTDPRGRLGLSRGEGPPPKRVVIVDDGQGPCGLLVDRVAGVVRLLRGTLEPCPQTLGSAGGDLLVGIGRERDRLFLVLDVAALLRPLRRAPEVRP